MIEIVPTVDIADIINIRPKKHYDDIPWIGDVTQRMHKNACFSVKVDGKVVALMGPHLIWDGCVTLWAITSDDMAGHGIGITRAVKRFMEQGAAVYGAHRLQMFVEVGFEDAERWAQALGFEFEARLRQYGPNKKDYWIFRRLF